jgi:FAD dependent oxidoreductase
MTEIKCQLCVVGGGSGGIGAALAAARLGVDTVLVEKNAILGGNSTVSGVNCWEPVAGATGIAYDIYRELTKIPDAAGIYSKGRHCCHPKHNNPPFPGGEAVIDSSRTYQDTLLRSGTKGLVKDEQRCREQWHGVIFEPEQFNKVVKNLLNETGNCRLLLNSSLAEVKMKTDSEVDYITLADGSIIKAALWIDNSGVLVKNAGAELLSGEDPKSRFNEPDAPEKPVQCLNGSTLIFRITPCDIAEIEPLAEDIPSTCWWKERFPSMACVQYPDGDRNCNMLPTINGKEYVELGENQAYVECTRRVKAFWYYIQINYPEFQRYRIKYLAERVGVRETFRVMCEYMLNENDLLQGISRQTHADIIALSDHMMDSHGANDRKSGELHEPYGIPYRSLIPAGFTNLAVVGRIAGFSTIAASSCRLSRTMMQLGQAAGTAAALAIKDKGAFPEVDTAEMRKNLKEQHVQLEWPVPPEIINYLNEK